MEANQVEAYIQKQDEEKQPLLNALRTLVKETAPELTESLKWGYPSYGEKKNVIYLAAQKKHINLGFYQGGSLADPDKLLEGTGAQMRHIKIKKMEDIKPELFKKLIRTAVAHQK
jgi:hypothetical protein